MVGNMYDIKRLFQDFSEYSEYLLKINMAPQFDMILLKWYIKSYLIWFFQIAFFKHL